REYDVHHVRPGSAGKESFDRGRHDFCFRFAGLVRVHQSPKTFDDDVHCVADFDKFFFALNRSRHVELKVEWHKFHRRLGQFTVVANRHDEIHAVYTDSFPARLLGAVAYPSAWDFWPDLIFDPGLGFVADPAGFTRKDQRGLARQRQKNIHIAVHNLEPGRIEDRALKAGVLIAADDQGV